MGGSRSSLLSKLPDGLWARAAQFLVLLLLGYFIATWPLTLATSLVCGGIVFFLLFLYPQYGVVLLAFAVPFGSLKQVHVGSIALGATEVLLALMIASWLAHMLAFGRVSFGRPPLVLPLLGFVAAGLVSLMGATSLSLSVVEIIKWVELLAIYLFVVHYLEGRESQILVLALIIAGAAEALLGVYQFLFQVGPPGFVLFGRFMRAWGTFGQPNPFGGYLGLTLPLALGIVMTNWNSWRIGEHEARWQRLMCWVVALVGTGLMGLAMIMSWSRGAWMGFAGAFVVMSVARGWRWVARLLLIAAVAVSLLIAADLLHLIPSSIFQRLGDLTVYLEGVDLRSVEITDENWAVMERLAHWQAASDMLESHPWTGVGMGNYALVYPEYALSRWQDPLGHAHNYYLHVGAEAGLVGLLAYVVLVVAWLRYAWRGATRARGYWQGVTLGVLGVLTHLTIHNLFDNLYVHGMYIQVGMMLGLLCVAVRQAAASECMGQ